MPKIEGLEKRAISTEEKLNMLNTLALNKAEKELSSAGKVLEKKENNVDDCKTTDIERSIKSKYLINGVSLLEHAKQYIMQKGFVENKDYIMTDSGIEPISKKLEKFLETNDLFKTDENNHILFRSPNVAAEFIAQILIQNTKLEILPKEEFEKLCDYIANNFNQGRLISNLFSEIDYLGRLGKQEIGLFDVNMQINGDKRSSYNLSIKENIITWEESYYITAIRLGEFLFDTHYYGSLSNEKLADKTLCEPLVILKSEMQLASLEANKPLNYARVMIKADVDTKPFESKISFEILIDKIVKLLKVMDDKVKRHAGFFSRKIDPEILNAINEYKQYILNVFELTPDKFITSSMYTHELESLLTNWFSNHQDQEKIDKVMQLAEFPPEKLINDKNIFNAYKEVAETTNEYLKKAFEIIKPELEQKNKLRLAEKEKNNSSAPSIEHKQ